jgi:3-deoxy-D-manno-octulosonic acid hydroxylase-like protein
MPDNNPTMKNSHPALLQVNGYQPKSWPAEQARWYCDQLERGHVLFFPTVPFDLPQSDREFLLSQKQAESRFHKNISFRPSRDLLKGVAADSPDHERLLGIMRHFSKETAGFVDSFLVPYAGKCKMDFASFRPLEEHSRDLPLHKRNDLLHVDAFPTRPTRGGRILRVFVNINAEASRIWNVGEPFHVFVPKLAQSEKLSPPYRGALARSLVHLASGMGLPFADRSRYDEFMLYFHDWLKENGNFQQNSSKQELALLPGWTWLVYTDGVPHAVMSGKFALEQTFIVPPEALVTPQVAPVRVLEQVTGMAMVS